MHHKLRPQVILVQARGWRLSNTFSFSPELRFMSPKTCMHTLILLLLISWALLMSLSKVFFLRKKKDVAREERIPGYIFKCDDTTMQECLDYGLFGSHARHLKHVKIRPGDHLFLFNSSSQLLYGIFEATSEGGKNLVQGAWPQRRYNADAPHLSRYPAQVFVKWLVVSSRIQV